MTKPSYAGIVGGLVRLYRQTNSIDLPTMAAAMGMSASGWSRVETGDTTMTVVQLRKAAAFLKVDGSHILRQADEVEALKGSSTTSKSRQAVAVPRRRR